jgi:hypothetical protein
MIVSVQAGLHSTSFFSSFFSVDPELDSQPQLVCSPATMSPSADFERLDRVAAHPSSNGVHLSNGYHTAAAANGYAPSTSSKRTEFLLDRNLHKSFPVVKGGYGNYLYLMDGRTVFDASAGAAVSCIGHGNKRVIKAISGLLNSGIPYLASTFWACEVVEELCKELINGTDGKMARVYLTGSGQCATPLRVQFLTSVSRF